MALESVEWKQKHSAYLGSSMQLEEVDNRPQSNNRITNLTCTNEQRATLFSSREEGALLIDAARIAGVKVNTAKSMMRVRRDEGRVDKKTVFGRPQRIIGEEESNLIVETLNERPDANADDLKRAVKNGLFVK